MTLKIKLIDDIYIIISGIYIICILTTNPINPINIYDLPNTINSLYPLLKDFLNLNIIPKIQFSYFYDINKYMTSSNI